ncbi:MAG: PaaI family thioesterase [Planctomycetaceae bacterium]|nr:PaaI family thioesterase [Planctomycetaceae bacterium]
MSAQHTMFQRKVPFLELLEIRPVGCEPGQATFECTVQHKHLRTFGILHGGVAATMLDTAMGYAAGTRAPEGHHLVTVQLSVNFTRPAREGDRLIAMGQVQHSGTKTAVVQGEIRTPENELVAAGTATFLYLPRPDSKPAATPQTSS